MTASERLQRDLDRIEEFERKSAERAYEEACHVLQKP
jgi:hypothetical protein